MRYWAVLKDAGKDFFTDNGLRLAAALAYYTVFALVPFLLLISGIASLVWDCATVQKALSDQLEGLFGTTTAQQINAMLTAAQPSSGALAALIGLGLLLLGATGIIGQLKAALNTVWDVKPTKKQGLLGIVRTRVFSLGLVVALSFLFIVSLAFGAALGALGTWASNAMPGAAFIIQVLSAIVGFVILAILFAILFKALPDITMPWRLAYIGGVLTAILFTIGKYAIGLYISRSSFSEQFGAGAALVILLVWVYYTAIIVFFSAEITQSYAHHNKIRLQQKR